jgi:septal ring factor EnvC (AmiA/AmiB activator)
MRGSRSAPVAIAGAAGALLLLLGFPLAAQEGGQKQVLDKALDVRAEGNKEAAATQDKIDEISDETDSLLSKYRTALKQIDSIRVYNSQMRELIDSQRKEMDSLADQLDRVEIVGRSVTPLMLRMIDSIERFVQLDVPFLLKERTDRIAKLRQTMNRADVSTAEKFRQIMEAYQIETEYGRTIEAYRDTIAINGRETTVDFLRFGRIALVYQSLDESQRGAWNQEERKWMPLGTEYRSAIRDGLRIARKQSAPDLIRLPLPAAREAKEAS